MNAWPDWLTDVRAPLRATLSSRLVRGRCCVCRRIRRCRFDLVNDRLFCSEECWDDRAKQEKRPTSFKMTDGQ